MSTTTEQEWRELSVCVDCAMAIANGAETEEQERAAELIAERWAGWWLMLDCGGDEPCEGFSWRSCEGCGSKLGGDRHRAAAHTGSQTRGETSE